MFSDTVSLQIFRCGAFWMGMSACLSGIRERLEVLAFAHRQARGLLTEILPRLSTWV